MATLSETEKQMDSGRRTNYPGSGAAERTDDPARNPDPITKAPGSHPVGTGIGAAAGGAAAIGAVAAGAAMGSVVGPVGTAVGAAVGAVVGGLVGKGVAESVNPTVEEEYWRNNYRNRPYVSVTSSYEEYGPAYQYGWESRTQYPDKDFDDVEPDLGRNWDSAKGSSTLSWDQARHATRDSWERIDDSSVSTLNSLIETLQDGKAGFEMAADKLDNAQIRNQFRDFAKQRAAFAVELQAEVRRLGGEEKTSGSAMGAVHRGWIDLKSAMGEGDKGILNEAERGEDAAVSAYEKALKTNLPTTVADIVRNQYLDVQQTHDRVKNLRDSQK